MKTPFAIILAALAGFGAAWFLAARQKEAAFTQERLALQAEFAASQSAAPTFAGRPKASAPEGFRLAKTPASLPSPVASEILEKLKTLRVSPGPRQHAAMRQVIHRLQSLVDLGPAALPAIREFLEKFEDVDYSPDWILEDEDNAAAPRNEQRDRPPLPGPRGAGSSPNRPVQLEFAMPPSLRLGLVEVLKEIGGDRAEQILAEMLTTSGRGVEVAYAARALQEIAPNKYRETAVAAARDLLANPPAIERPGILDDNARAYLYAVFDLFGNVSVPANVQSLLITPDGHIDRTTLNYLTALKEQSVPALFEAYRDPRVTNMSEKATLAAQILSYAGVNAQANEAFLEIVSDESTASWLRALSIQSLAGGRGAAFTGAMPVDPAQIQSRIELLESLGELSDETMARARADAVMRLSNRLGTLTSGGDTAPSFRARGGANASAAGTLPPP